jgi:anti-sigma factor RsiW
MWQPEVRAGELTRRSRLVVDVETGRRCDARQRRLARVVRGRVAAALLIAGIANAACYTYVPVSLGSIASKNDVRVRVTENAAARLSKDLGAFSTEIDGEFTQQGPDSVSLGVTIDRQYRGTTIGTATQVLFLGRSEVVEVRKREFSRSRTVLLAAGTVVGFGLLAAGITQLVDPNGPSEDQPPPPPPPQLRRPLGYHLTVRIPIP